MQSIVSLNDLYADFSAGLLEKKEFEGAIFRVIEGDIRRFPWFSQEDHEDYILWLYPRISRAITAYRETGSSFEAYIGTLVRLTAKEYHLRLLRGSVAESTAWIAQIPEMCVEENEPQYDEYTEVALEKPTKHKNPRQLLILVLKCCNFLSVDFLERISPKLGIEPEALRAMASRLMAQRAKREKAITLLRERATCQFFRCVFYERTLRSMPKDSVKAQQLTERLERGRNRLEKMRTRLARLRPDPSNRQIAKILGVAKGTVDAALFTLKSKGEQGTGSEQRTGNN